MQRFVYGQNGFELFEEVPSDNMGDAETLVDFLDFANTCYPSDHTIAIVWNHGGGTVGGVAYDEIK